MTAVAYFAWELDRELEADAAWQAECEAYRREVFGQLGLPGDDDAPQWAPHGAAPSLGEAR
jgi:hypothetical protein